MFANLLNFVFNAFLGRVLNSTDFGTVTLINTVIYLSTILIGSVAGTVNRETAYLEAKEGPHAGVTFFDYVKKYSISISLFLSLLWLIMIPFMSEFFNINNTQLLLYCTPFIFAGILGGIYRGFIQGNFLFSILAILLAFEAIIKLALAGVFVVTGWNEWVAVSIPLSITLSFIASWFYGERVKSKIVKEYPEAKPIKINFPYYFYIASVVTGLSSAVFLSVDVILVKHYFDPIIAGQYALLSLVGKMIYFLGSLLNIFIITMVSGDEGKGNNPHDNFYKIVAGTVTLLGIAFIFMGPLGDIFVPFLLGNRSLPIIPYITQYSLATALFTLGSTVTMFHLARKQYIFSALALFISGVFCLGIVMFHDSIQEVVNVFIAVSSINLILVTILHFTYRLGERIVKNTKDILKVFTKIPEAPLKSSEGKNILIFNWRDKENAFAGGAELYIHEIAERWANSGHSVTLFCSNDGHQNPDTVINNMRIIRRGGFLGVYVCAALYYIFKFRGKFDVIIDCENGIPFFTPIFAKEPVYILIHHIHQEIFYKYLTRPLAFIAATLEKSVMPIVYRNTQFITISNSSKEDIVNLNLTKKEVYIINPGINPEQLSPGEKSTNPTILSVGRLKAYKSINVLIKAFKIVSERVPEAELIIAGDGDCKKELESLAKELNLENNVRFLGKISEAEKVSLLQKAWVFVNPSMMEGWGITSIEANACGTPIVASNVQGLKDSVKDNFTGFLVEYGNVNEFGEKILSIIQNDDLRKEMEVNSIEWSKGFGWDKLSEDFKNIILKN
jgi:glycosyltransferase involved in cell wall biosynthesis/O-antigen/teichoic acid export membrane protein